VLAAALAGAADLIASGDRRDLLPLGSYAGISIVTAREAWERLAPQQP
jgi:predicted nucleic acid-binding protein